MSSGHDSNFVSLSTAQYFAERLIDPVFNDNEQFNGSLREIADYFTLIDSVHSQVGVYVFNYADGGFSVISADFRYQPVLAYSAHGPIHTTDTIPSMLGSWFGRMVENVSVIREGKIDNAIIGYNEWHTLYNLVNPDLEGPTVFVPAGPYNELDESGWLCANPGPVNIQVGPLMTTAWGQGCTYNNQMSTCNNTAPQNCGRKPVGCVATAMAQVIRYWAGNNTSLLVTNYNWAAMPNNQGNAQVQEMMHLIGASVSMNYGCNSSGANSSNIDDAFIGTWNYTTADHEGYDHPTDIVKVINNLNNGQPVILGGYRSRALGFLWGTNGHAWVCDGYRVRGLNCAMQYWYNMNWGWNGTDNGWYFVDDWTTTAATNNRNYQYPQDMIYNIHP